MNEKKFTYTKKGQVKVKRKSSKFSYSKRGQVKFKPKRRRENTTKLAPLVEWILFEQEIETLKVVNPATNRKIKVKSALGYDKSTPVYKAAIALLQKHRVTIPTGDVSKSKPGEQGTLFMPEPFEIPAAEAIHLEKNALSGEDAITELEFEQETYLRELEYETRNILEKYTGSAFMGINSFLRGFEDEAADYLENQGEIILANEPDWRESVSDLLEEWIDRMDKAFEGKEAELKKDVIVWRGIQNEDVIREFYDAGEGGTFSDSAFISTSFDERIAQQFSNQTTLLKIVAQKGTRAVYPDAAGLGYAEGGSTEKELILKRGQEFEIIKIEQRDGESDIIHARTV